MARRVVVVGAKREPKAGSPCPAVAVTALDASALIASGMCRVEVALRGGELADALTLTFTSEYLAALRGDVHAKAWKSLMGVLRNAVEFDVATPIPFE